MGGDKRPQQQQQQHEDHSDTQSCTSSSTNSSTNKNVQFCARKSTLEEIRRISRISNFSEEEWMAIWTTEDEMLLRKQELKAAVHECKHNARRVSDDQFSRLGLHDKFGEGKRYKDRYRKNARQAVLDEQNLQRDEGLEDLDMLADVYFMSNHKSQEQAQQMAAKLEEEVLGSIVKGGDLELEGQQQQQQQDSS